MAMPGDLGLSPEQEQIKVKISELLKKDGNKMSFEVFPPKTDDKYESVSTAAKSIASLHPAFMSVTYGAGGGTSVSPP